MGLLGDFTTGVSRLPYRILGAPVDLAATALGPLGYRHQKPVMGSEWLIDQGIKAGIARPRTGGGAELAGDVVSGLLDPSPSTEFALASKLGGLLGDPAVANKVGGGLLEALTVFHASPHKIDNISPDAPHGRFDLSKVGSGEGNAMVGHGIYLAESPDVSGKGGTYYRQFKDATGNAHSYKVDLPDEHIEQMLDWDAPLDSQPQAIKALADRMGFGREGALAGRYGDAPAGMNLYAEVVRRIEGGDRQIMGELQQLVAEGKIDIWGDANQKASEYMRHVVGAPGIKYYDGFSRNQGKGTRNFVVFDPSVTTILGRE